MAGSSILMLLLAIEPNVLRIPPSFTTEDELMPIVPRYVLRLPSGCHPHPRPPPQARTAFSSGDPSRNLRTLMLDARVSPCLSAANPFSRDA